MTKRRNDNRYLREGEVIRLEPKGPTWKVVRTTWGAAYVQRFNVEPRLVELPSGKTFLARAEGAAKAIAPNAFVYPE